MLSITSRRLPPPKINYALERLKLLRTEIMKVLSFRIGVPSAWPHEMNLKTDRIDTILGQVVVDHGRNFRPVARNAIFDEASIYGHARVALDANGNAGLAVKNDGLNDAPA